jgi:hypothetical protein
MLAFSYLDSITLRRSLARGQSLTCSLEVKRQEFDRMHRMEKRLASEIKAHDFVAAPGIHNPSCSSCKSCLHFFLA